jgi:hypothetical protein
MGISPESDDALARPILATGNEGKATVGWEFVVIAASLLGFSVVSRRLAGTSITSAIVFVGVGLLAGIQALDLFDAQRRT